MVGVQAHVVGGESDLAAGVARVLFEVDGGLDWFEEAVWISYLFSSYFAFHDS